VTNSESELGTQQPPARLEIIAVSLSYGVKNILDDLSFQVPHGLSVGVIGPNGAGKSTLFKALVGLLPINQGQILIHGRPLGLHQDCVAYIPQREEVDWSFPVTVQDVVMMGRVGRQGWLKPPTKFDREVVQQSLSRMKIEHLSRRPIGELSGGQQQRVFLSRALAQEPHILLMDEPFTGIDAPTQEILMQLLVELREQQVTVMVSTHDLNMAAKQFDRVLLINRHLIAYGIAAEVLTSENIHIGFGGQVLDIGGAIVVDQCCPGDEDHHHQLE
jgi:manganese/iron transport system ATP-binding protein